MLTASNISKTHETVPILKDLSLTVEPGEVLVIIGPSGVGKTTLLRLFALSHRPDTGVITFDGRDVWAADQPDRRQLRRRIGMVFQDAGLFYTTVARNVEYGLRVRRSWSRRIRDQLRSLIHSPEPPPAVSDALATVGLQEKMQQPTSALSGGESQRVSFARALAYDPDVLLLDEPTSDLDPRNTAIIESAITAARRHGIGVVVATHDMHQAKRIADRIAVLLTNNITEIAPPETIFENPTDERTRKFITGELIY